MQCDQCMPPPPHHSCQECFGAVRSIIKYILNILYKFNINYIQVQDHINVVISNPSPGVYIDTCSCWDKLSGLLHLDLSGTKLLTTSGVGCPTTISGVRGEVSIQQTNHKYTPKSEINLPQHNNLRVLHLR